VKKITQKEALSMFRSLILCLCFCLPLAAQKPVGVAVDCLEGSVWQGQPAVFGMHLCPADIADPKVESGVLSIRIQKSSGEAAAWPLKPLVRISFPIEFKAMQSATEYWVLSPEDTAALEAGDYTAEARLDALPSRRYRFKVLAVEDENAAPLLRLRANYLTMTGNTSGAVALLQEAIVRQPRDTGLLFQLAVAQEQSGNLKEALASIERAIALFKELFPNAQHPPLEYMRLRSKLDWGIE
jgi:tetratricopeptide (TPR) repeat protein